VYHWHHTDTHNVTHLKHIKRCAGPAEVCGPESGGYRSQDAGYWILDPPRIDGGGAASGTCGRKANSEFSWLSEWIKSPSECT